MDDASSKGKIQYESQTQPQREEEKEENSKCVCRCPLLCAICSNILPRHISCRLYWSTVENPHPRDGYTSKYGSLSKCASGCQWKIPSQDLHKMLQAPPMPRPANLVPQGKNREQTHHTVPMSSATLKTLKIEQKTDEGNLSCYKLTQIPELRTKDQVLMGRLKSRKTPQATSPGLHRGRVLWEEPRL